MDVLQTDVAKFVRTDEGVVLHHAGEEEMSVGLIEVLLEPVEILRGEG